MKRVITLLIVITMIFPAMACKGRNNSDNNDNPATIEPTITPDGSQVIEETSKRISAFLTQKHDSVSDVNGKEAVSIDYDTAVVFIDDKPVEYFGKVLQEQADSFLKFFYNMSTDEISQIDSNYKYEADYKISPQRMDEGVISFAMTEYANTLGPYPNISRLAVSFDVEKQCQIKLKDLTGDYSALEKFLHEYVLKLISEHKHAENFFDGYEDKISSIIADGLWYFSDDGITFICNTDVIAPHAVGIMEFTVPYDELSIYIDKRYNLKEHVGGADDTSSVNILSDYDTSGYKVLKLNLDGGGRTFAIVTDKTVYDVTVSSVTYDSDNEEFIINRALYKCNRLTNRELLEITADIPEVTPDLQLTYKLVDGSTITNYISESGKDGSLFLSEL